jgi:hypothetical protein
MVRRQLWGICVLALVLGASSAWAGIPDPTNSYATTMAQQDVSVLVSPSGIGSQLSACFAYQQGPVADATIELWVRDAVGDPIYLFPSSDMWLETASKGMVLCPGGSTADQSTDINGYTTFSHAIFAGCCGSGIVVTVNGQALSQAPFSNIYVNSPDMNCNLVVNLSDVVVWATVFFGTYDYCADFYWDGLLNLSDIVILAQSIAATCP